MVVIKENIYIKDNVFRKHTKKTVECDSCGRDLLFFDIPPVTCCYCNTSMPNMRRLINEQEYRVDYHSGVFKV